MRRAPVTDRPAPAHAERRACLRATAVLGALFVLLLVLVAARWGPLMRLDARTAADLHRVAVAHPGWTHVNRVLTDWVWDPLTMRVLLALAVLWALWRRELRTALWLVVCGVAGSVLEQGVKSAVGRARPRWPDPVDSASYAAFPSGHAMTAAVVCGALLWLFLRRTGAGVWWRGAAWALAVVSVVGVGFTRVYLGVHWPSDVVGGWLFGGAVVAGSAAVCSPWLEESRP
ncbi:phosphatase PAP2 family protein [Actinacidiphila oryziradicis]|jgi:undecaprenyl-diphosphatase|uniref:phosphatase PAP2 family protein n=1 Tax=Actinacidiphila oryziradicis TaxID=2571141 RepID=UPI0023F39E6D|nr:phosphatase PAP2 family protein [Actinacidiphila oryziradicis]MCW2872019.1 phosphoesterase PA-phosphatase related protein [Actinacidiphila oryziradicis]